MFDWRRGWGVAKSWEGTKRTGKRGVHSPPLSTGIFSGHDVYSSQGLTSAKRI
jgi:hypothetical protein